MVRHRRRRVSIAAHLAATGLLLVVGPTTVDAVSVPTRLFFSHGSSSAYGSGQIVGQTGRHYALAVNADQRVTITLETADPALRFDVIPPNAKEPLYVGRSADQPTWSGTLAAAGDYIISVYTVRADAPPDSKSKYKLIVTLS